ncbi:Protein KINESIN LIGHT CHAIN-RELATED 1 [Linum perenne]
MPGLVSVKTPPGTPQLSVSLPSSQPHPGAPSRPESSSVPRTPNSNSNKKLPSPSPSRSNPDLGPFLLKLARDTIASGEGPSKALEYAIRASKSFERCAVEGEPSLDLVMSLHVLGAIYCSLGKFEEAVPVLERAITVPDLSRGIDHALAAFSGYMQLGDTYSMIGQVDKSIYCYEEGLKIQIESLGDTDPRVGETCRYLAEAHVQAMNFEKAEELSKKTLEIHRAHSEPASIEEAADRRLMALIYEAKGDYEAALEHLVLASMAMIANGQDNEVAAIDVSIGNTYMSLCRFDEAVFSYQKALTVFKSSKGDAIEILEYVLKLREEKLGIANPDFEDEKSRLAELLKEAGRARNKKAKSLENLIDPNSKRTTKKESSTKKWGFRI